MKITLCIAPWDMWEDENYSVYPLGLAYLGAMLEKNKYEVNLLNLSLCKLEDAKKEIIKHLSEQKPDFFGFSILSNSRISARELIKLVKELSPQTKILAGGIHTTFMYEQILNNYPVDFAVLGEGEYTLLELLDAIQKKKSISFLKKIKGIAFKYEGEIIKTENRERIKELDRLPLPKHNFFSEQIKKTKTAYIITSRGCPFSCSFCPSSAYWGRHIIQRSAENILEEIKYLLNEFPDLEYINFSDDEFICNNQRVISLCQMIIREKIKIKWRCLGRVSSITEEVIKNMKEAGCCQITFGVESGSQRILDGIGKKVKISQIVDAFNICRKYEIQISCLTIVGLPGENRQSVNETIALCKKLKINTEPAILIIFPGTEVYKLAKEKGFLTDEYWLGEDLCPLYLCEHPKWKLWWWSFKTGLITYYHDKDVSAYDFFYDKIIKKFKPSLFIRIFKRYITDKT